MCWGWLKKLKTHQLVPTGEIKGIMRQAFTAKGAASNGLKRQWRSMASEINGSEGIPGTMK